MPAIPDSHLDLATSPMTAMLATVGADGTPQVTAVWFVLDGDVITMSLTTDRQKTKNMAARPKATLFLLDPANAFRTLEVRGDVTIEDDPELAMFDKAIRSYGQDPATFPAPKENRVKVTIVPTRIVAQG